MLNQTVLVGRLVKDPELKETESGKYEKDGETHYTMNVVAEKVTFLSNGRQTNNPEE